jgi:ABC-type glutathione transport system ATPase component
MLLRPSNMLLLDEPATIDLDSKEVLLDALVDYGGTLIFVSHDRYFVERLATKIIEVGNGTATMYPGTYKEFLWHKEHPVGPDRQEDSARGHAGASSRDGAGRAAPASGSLEPRVRRDERAEPAPRGGPQPSDARPAPGPMAPRHRKKGQHAEAIPAPVENAREEKKRADTEARRRSRADQARRTRIDELESGSPTARTPSATSSARWPRQDSTRSLRSATDHRSPPGALVDGRRSDAPVEQLNPAPISWPPNGLHSQNRSAITILLQWHRVVSRNQ